MGVGRPRRHHRLPNCAWHPPLECRSPSTSSLKDIVAGCPGSRGVRDPGGPSSITRPAKPRTHPGLEKHETLRQAQGRLWGTHSYLISLPKIKDGSGQETRATRPLLKIGRAHV